MYAQFQTLRVNSVIEQLTKMYVTMNEDINACLGIKKKPISDP